ncbi:MAG: hypothetical protein J7L51_00855 [Desulfurococcales archaeon]|nr:hypothetical protein [Desulfurococcales archaeon]
MIKNILSMLVDELASATLRRSDYALTYDYSIKDIHLFLKDVQVVELGKPKSRYEVLALDVASATIHIGGGEVALATGCVVGKKLVTYPSLIRRSTEGPPFIGAPIMRELSLITNKYIMLGIRYSDDPDLPEGALTHDVRIALETHLIREAPRTLAKNGLLLVDGPIHYPITHPKEGTIWNFEIEKLNEGRVKAMYEVLEVGLLPISVVKRVWGSKHLAKKVGLSSTRDVALIESMISTRYEKLSKPLMIGPLTMTEHGIRKVLTYVVVPTSKYSKVFTIFRIEMLKDVVDSLGSRLTDVMSSLAHSTVSYGTSLPYKLEIADSVSKELTAGMASLIEMLLKIKGIPVLYGGVTIG